MLENYTSRYFKRILRCKLPAILLGILFVVLTGCEATNEHEILGKSALDNKEYPVAVEHFSEAIAQDARSISAHLGRAQAHEAQGEFNAAIEDYEYVLALKPQQSTANERLAAVYLSSGDGFKAREQLAKVEKQLKPREYLFSMARAELLCGESKQSLEYLNRLIASDPSDTQGRYYRGVVNLNLGNLEAAEEDFSAAIELAPELASAYWRRALVRDRLRETKSAEEDRKRATELDPAHAFADSELGKNMLQLLKSTDSEAGAISLQSLRQK